MEFLYQFALFFFFFQQVFDGKGNLRDFSVKVEGTKWVRNNNSFQREWKLRKIGILKKTKK